MYEHIANLLSEVSDIVMPLCHKSPKYQEVSRELSTIADKLKEILPEEHFMLFLDYDSASNHIGSVEDDYKYAAIFLYGLNVGLGMKKAATHDD